MIDLVPFAAAVPAAVVGSIGQARNVLAVSHENPDADTIGAALAVALIVEANGGTATVLCTDPIPELYRFLPGIERYRTDPDPSATYDLVVVCDCGSLDRIGAVLERHRALFERLPHVIIDHHASNGGGGAVDWIEPSSAATCEMVALLATRLGVPLDASGGALASTLIAGIVMDTATFAHPNTTPRTLSVSAALVEAGAPLADASRRLDRTKPNRQLRLFGRVLERLETSPDGCLIWSTLLASDLEATGSPPSHSEGIIDLLAQSESADVALLFKEAGAETRLSVRTRPGGVDATELTGLFGGGGHPRAAGATLAMAVADARQVVLSEAERLVARIASTSEGVNVSGATSERVGASEG